MRTITRLNRYRRLTDARARFEWVVDHSDDGFLIVTPSGVIQYANAQAGTYLGAPALDTNLATTFAALSHSPARYHHSRDRSADRLDLSIADSP